MPPNTNSNTNTRTNAKRPFADDDDLIAIQEEHDRIFDKARAIGLPCSQDNLDDLVKLYEETGLEEARRLNKISMAYISKVAVNHTEKPTATGMTEDEANAILASLA